MEDVLQKQIGQMVLELHFNLLSIMKKVKNLLGKSKMSVGGEKCILNGDDSSEHLLSEIVGAVPYIGERHLNMESLYEYGSRSGFWRLHRLFTRNNIPCTVFAVGMALEKNPDAARAMVSAGWEIASHG
jgi:peptidoglycan/xylan/chitin deacetylase (PgdA/CDA1 family)